MGARRRAGRRRRRALFPDARTLRWDRDVTRGTRRPRADPRALPRGRGRRAHRHADGREGPRPAGGDAGRRDQRRHRPAHPRLSRRRAHVPAADAGRPGRAGRGDGGRRRASSSRPTRRTTTPSSRRRSTTTRASPRPSCEPRRAQRLPAVRAASCGSRSRTRTRRSAREEARRMHRALDAAPRRAGLRHRRHRPVARLRAAPPRPLALADSSSAAATPPPSSATSSCHQRTVDVDRQACCSHVDAARHHQSRACHPERAKDRSPSCTHHRSGYKLRPKQSNLRALCFFPVQSPSPQPHERHLQIRRKRRLHLHPRARARMANAIRAACRNCRPTSVDALARTPGRRRSGARSPRGARGSGACARSSGAPPPATCRVKRSTTRYAVTDSRPPSTTAMRWRLRGSRAIGASITPSAGFGVPSTSATYVFSTRPLLELARQRVVRGIVLRDEDHAGRVAVEPVHDARPQHAADAREVRAVREDRVHERRRARARATDAPSCPAAC